MKVLIIIRGLPGSGKSFLANELQYSLGTTHGTVVVCEADNFFYVDDKYVFNKTQVPEAHKYCYGLAKLAMEEVKAPYVIVSNTATRQWEYKKYIDLAREHGYKVQVIDVHGEFENVHGVPEEHLTKMAERWEPFNRDLLKHD